MRVRIGFCGQIAFSALLAINLLHHIILIFPLESFPFFEEVVIKVGLLIWRRMQGVRALCSFSRQPLHVVEETFPLNDFMLSMGGLWLSIRSASTTLPLPVIYKTRSLISELDKLCTTKVKYSHTKWCV